MGGLFAAVLATRQAHAQAQPEVDLIHALGLVVRVSSTVGNGRDLPTHLIDGDLATAWSSRTGELTGARIEVAIPAGATVTGIAMTAGLSRRAPRDLFAMNPRVSRVEVLRDGVRVREAALDVGDASVQTVAVSGGGGLWTVRVLDVTLGTRPTWREVSVSEFRVLGRAPTPVTAPAPQVWVDEAALGRGRAAAAIAGPFVDAAAYCATQRSTDMAQCHSPYDEDPASNACGCVDPAPQGGSPEGVTRLPSAVGPVRGARVLRVVTDVHELDACVLLVETARGTYAIPGFADCGAPAMAHDYDLATHVDVFTAVETPGGGARLTLHTREVETRADMQEAGGPAGTTATRRAALTVGVTASGEVFSAVRAAGR